MKQDVPIEYHAPMVSRGQFESIPLSAAREPSQLEANMSDVHFLFAHPPVFGVEGNAAFDNARVRDAAVVRAKESI
jgi:hypothetical protein